MYDLYGELIDKKDKQIEGLRRNVSILQKRNYELECKLKELIPAADIARQEANKLRDSLNKMTAERSKWLKKLKRAGLTT